MTAFVLAALATVSFDGIFETPTWGRSPGAAIGLFCEIGTVGALGYVGAQSLINVRGN